MDGTGQSPARRRILLGDTERDRLTALLRELAGLGIDHVMLSPRGLWTEQNLAAVASILPEVHKIGVDTGR